MSVPGANISRDLVTYKFPFDKIEPLQRDLTINYSLDIVGRLKKYYELPTAFKDIDDSNIKLLTAACACSVCGDSPLVPGSKHQFGTETQRLWEMLLQKCSDISANLREVTQAHLSELESDYKAVQKSYERENVSATCSD
ncbi:uncharacterized protein PAC_17564 [Phialocephala subalpina]|uniref:Uncharacterized protein n=1 Tax=Phialocephala subalpina TaxID=576137 RepID=A0A1L7XRN1_9HELO|nr:uncharacterized protein PAC_17564 [Phialocephala subalpina]